jgi:hypothetical protein
VTNNPLVTNCLSKQINQAILKTKAGPLKDSLHKSAYTPTTAHPDEKTKRLGRSPLYKSVFLCYCILETLSSIPYPLEIGLSSAYRALTVPTLQVSFDGLS